jgi:hypothetical protein
MEQNITNPNIDNAILRAERAVENSLTRFEAAMEHLAEKADVTSHQLQHVRDVGKRSKDQILHLKDEISSTIEPVMPYVSRARSASRQAVAGVSRNSRPLLVSAAGLIGGYLFYRYFLKGRSATTSVNQISTTPHYTTGQSADQFANLTYPR